MDLGAFLKTALYRVIFVLIVGIPAVETFSFLFFDNGILIQQIKDNNPPFEGSAKLGFDQIMFSNKKASQIKAICIENKICCSYPLELNLQKAEIKFSQTNSTISLNNPDVFEIGKIKFTLRDLSTTGWILYLGLAWILGEILCFLGDLIIGFIGFHWRFWACDENIEKIFRCCDENNFITSYHFANISSTILEISEVHFVLSRVFSGFFLLSIVWLKIHIIENILFSSLPSLIFIIMSIIYRIHANRLIYWSAQQQGQQGDDNPRQT